MCVAPYKNLTEKCARKACAQLKRTTEVRARGMNILYKTKIDIESPRSEGAELKD